MKRITVLWIMMLCLWSGSSLYAAGETYQRVVVLDYSALDLMDTLGLEDHVAAVPKSGLPGYLSKYHTAGIADLGNLMKFDMEVIKNLQPDLIIISGRQNASKEELEKIAPTLNWSIDNNHLFSSFRETNLAFAALWGKEDAAKTRLAAIDKQLAELRKLAAKKNVNALVVLHNAEKFSPQGSGSRYGFIHEDVGIAKAYESPDTSQRQSLSNDAILDIDPDILFIMDRDVITSRQPSNKQAIEDETIQETKAYQNRNIVYLPPEIWYLSNSGLTSLPMMLDEIRAALENADNSR